MAAVEFPVKDVNPKLESYVARLLDEAGVPNFIWGEPVLSIYGVPTVTFVYSLLPCWATRPPS